VTVSARVFAAVRTCASRLDTACNGIVFALWRGIDMH
jgi:hypothetical protein